MLLDSIMLNLYFFKGSFVKKKSFILVCLPHICPSTVSFLKIKRYLRCMLTCFNRYIKERHTTSWHTLWKFWCKAKPCQILDFAFFYVTRWANESHIWLITYETVFLCVQGHYTNMQVEWMSCITNRLS